MKLAKYTYYFLLLIPVTLLGQIKTTLLHESSHFHGSVSTFSSVHYARDPALPESPLLLLRKSVFTYDSTGCGIHRSVHDSGSAPFEASSTCITTDSVLIHLTKNKSGDTVFFRIIHEISSLETITRSKNQEYQFYCRKLFDTLGRIIYTNSISTFVKSRLEDGLSKEYFYTYDIPGHLTKIKSIKDSGTEHGKIIETTEYTYDGHGNKVHEQLLRYDNFPLHHFVYTYNALNQLIRTEFHSTDYSWTEQFFYNEQGDVIRKIVDRPKEKKHFVTTITYKYDLRGNWIYREESLDKLLINKEIRQFEYYH
ncbi:hypothetical protein [Fluviicola sp.]|uniref:hypothetical protein n=1 Tax=Fluviicola sp. TaxID=1917219 RepID=UPI00262A43C7|nr:hypothetical protein [Fluviicola sp.]